LRHRALGVLQGHRPEHLEYCFSAFIDSGLQLQERSSRQVLDATRRAFALRCIASTPGNGCGTEM